MPRFPDVRRYDARLRDVSGICRDGDLQRPLLSLAQHCGKHSPERVGHRRGGDGLRPGGDQARPRGTLVTGTGLAGLFTSSIWRPRAGELLLKFGELWFKGLTVGTGPAPVARYNRYLRDLIVAGRAKPSMIVSHSLPLEAAPEAYAKFGKREPGYTKVVLKPGLTPS
jgi:threonine dehydrogenase-like Zn-dependent dehydrogenase